LQNNQTKFTAIPDSSSDEFGDYLVLLGAIMREEMMIDWLKCFKREVCRCSCSLVSYIAKVCYTKGNKKEGDKQVPPMNLVTIWFS